MLTRINLLPWREARRKDRQRRYAMVAAATLGGVIGVVLAVHFAMAMKIEHQEARNAFLRQEIAQLDAKLTEIRKLEATRQALVDRIEVIQGLQATRPSVVHLFDELVKTIPPGTYLTSLKQDDNGLTLEGKAESQTRVSAYMRQIDGSRWMDGATLDVIETKDSGSTRVSNFRLNAKLTEPTEGAAQGAAAVVTPAKPPAPRS